MAKKFGAFKGVFIPSTEAILGTVLFLLMPLLVADVGLLIMLPLVFLAHTVTISTSFSLSDCATNINNIEGGGLYALSKLSLGKAMGGSIGIMLYFAQAASIGFYTVGFTEVLHGVIAPHLQFIPLFSSIEPGSILLQKQLLSTIFLIVFFIIVIAGADFTLKIQSFIMVVLIFSVLSIFIAPLFNNLRFEDSQVFLKDWNWRGNRNITIPLFFLAFTQFFPAVTGISTGIGMSGDLKDPRKSIVKGTFAAIGFTMVIYFAATLVYGKIDPSLLIQGYSDGTAKGVILTELFGLTSPFPQKILGLMILAGVVFATGSSALSVFMTGPRTAQFLARDNILPGYLSFLQMDFKSGGDEPRFAIVVSFFFGLLIIWMGDINFAATVVGILFLVVYGWVNGAAFLERISNNPSFRPTFKNHWSISFYGFLA
ncbi:MAG: amino acid permease [Spirochaetaceae bacterium]|jgi:amino acid transporter|nr:amino acid permease [Spirochaetaceae bacterium]